MAQNELYQIYGTSLPFQGRRSELEHLARELQVAAREGKARAIQLTGPGGLGKSRLAQEFIDALVNQGHDIRSYWTSFSHRKLEPGFAPLTQIIRQHFGIRTEDKDDLARDKLVSGLVELVDGARLNDAARLLGALLQLPFAFEFGEVDRGDLLQFMERAYQTCLNLILLDNSPVVLVIDNMDAAPNTIKEWFRALTASLSNAPILIILIGQEEDHFPTLPEAIPLAPQIVLTPLSDDDILETVAGFLGCERESLIESLADCALERANGSPRNIENLLRLLVQRQVITPAADGWTFFPKRLTQKEVPLSMQGIGRERILTLPPAERAILEAAAILGSPFWMAGVLSLLEATTPSPKGKYSWKSEVEESLSEGLQILQDMEMIAESEGAALRGEEEFIFVSAHERREVLELIDPEKRKLLHRLAAQWMTRKEANELSVWNLTISQQFQSSGSTYGAARHLVLAANHARLAFNNSLAVHLYEEAITLMDSDQAELLLEASAKLAWTHRMMGRAVPASKLYRECLRLARVLGDPREAARVINQIGSLEMEEGHYEVAQKAFLQALKMYQNTRDLAGVASVRDDLGQLLWHVGAKNAYEEATAQFEQSLALRQELGDDRSVARCLTQLGHMDFLRGYWTEAEKRYRSALEIRRKLGDIRGQAISMNGLGCLFHEKGEHKRAVQVWHEVERLARSVGDQALRAMAHINLGEVHLKLGDFEKGEAELQVAEQISEETRNVRVLGHVQRVQAELAIEQGNIERAEERCAQASAIAQKTGNRSLAAISLTARARLRTIQFENGEKERAVEAERDILTAVSLLEEMGDLVELERALHVQARLHRAHGSEAEALKVVERAGSLRPRTVP